MMVKVLIESEKVLTGNVSQFLVLGGIVESDDMLGMFVEALVFEGLEGGEEESVLFG